MNCTFYLSINLLKCMKMYMGYTYINRLVPFSKKWPFFLGVVMLILIFHIFVNISLSVSIPWIYGKCQIIMYRQVIVNKNLDYVRYPSFCTIYNIANNVESTPSLPMIHVSIVTPHRVIRAVMVVVSWCYAFKTEMHLKQMNQVLVSQKRAITLITVMKMLLLFPYLNMSSNHIFSRIGT